MFSGGAVAEDTKSFWWQGHYEDISELDGKNGDVFPIFEAINLEKAREEFKRMCDAHQYDNSWASPFRIYGPFNTELEAKGFSPPDRRITEKIHLCK